MRYNDVFLCSFLAGSSVNVLQVEDTQSLALTFVSFRFV